MLILTNFRYAYNNICVDRSNPIVDPNEMHSHYTSVYVFDRGKRSILCHERKCRVLVPFRS